MHKNMHYEFLLVRYFFCFSNFIFNGSNFYPGSVNLGSCNLCFARSMCIDYDLDYDDKFGTKFETSRQRHLQA